MGRKTRRAFYRDTVGEFETGDVTLALHPASDKHPAGGVEIGFTTENLREIYADREAGGVSFTQAPFEEHGTLLSRSRDSEGADISLSGKP